MRVIAGAYRGRILQAPKGRTTRPTTDRVRESLFSALASLRGGFEGACVLDAFAGSGALGIEALSRGASFCCFCERDRAALAVLEANTSILDVDSFCVWRGDIAKRLPSFGPYDLVLLDPPYAFESESLVRVLHRLADAGLLAQDAVVSHERAASSEAAALNAACSLQLQSSRSFGDTVLDIYRKDCP